MLSKISYGDRFPVEPLTLMSADKKPPVTSTTVSGQRLAQTDDEKIIARVSANPSIEEVLEKIVRKACKENEDIKCFKFAYHNGETNIIQEVSEVHRPTGDQVTIPAYNQMENVSRIELRSFITQHNPKFQYESNHIDEEVTKQRKLTKAMTSPEHENALNFIVKTQGDAVTIEIQDT